MIFSRIYRLFVRLFYMGVIELLRKFTHQDTYVVTGMLFLQNADPIDSWTFFRWLQDNHVPSKYLVKKNDAFYDKEIKGKGYKDIIVLKNEDDILYHLNLWIHAKAFVAEWNLVSKTLDKWFKHLPNMKYVLLQHGIIGNQTSKFLKEGTKTFDLINVSSAKEKQIVESFPGVAEGTCFIAGLPRYDFLIDRADHTAKEKYLFVMFTWRSFTKDTTQQTIEESCFWKNIMKLFSKDRLQWLAQNNVKLVFALHHSMHQSITNLQFNQNVIIARQDEIKFWITHAHALVTDFSSIAFDFLFINKPVIYWIPDISDQTTIHNEPDQKIASAIERRKDLFNTADTIEDLFEIISIYIDNGFTLEEEKKAAARHWFAYQSDFSQRVYEAIEQRTNNK